LIINYESVKDIIKYKMNKNNGIKKIRKIAVDLKNGKLMVFENVYIKIKPEAIDTSDWEDFRIIHYFLLKEVKKFEIEE